MNTFFSAFLYYFVVLPGLLTLVIFYYLIFITLNIIEAQIISPAGDWNYSKFLKH